MATSLQLTPRDHELLSHLASYRFVSAHQLAHSLFPTEHAASHRLRELARHQLVVRIPIRVRSEASTPASAWALKPLGARYVAAASAEVKPPSLKSGEERTSHHLEHTLARNTFRLVLSRLSELHPK